MYFIIIVLIAVNKYFINFTNCKTYNYFYS